MTRITQHGQGSMLKPNPVCKQDWCFYGSRVSHSFNVSFHELPQEISNESSFSPRNPEETPKPTTLKPCCTTVVSTSSVSSWNLPEKCLPCQMLDKLPRCGLRLWAESYQPSDGIKHLQGPKACKTITDLLLQLG